MGGIKEQWLALREKEARPQDWPEDFPHENGLYTCVCCSCGMQFDGHKRRVTCRVCSNSKE